MTKATFKEILFKCLNMRSGFFLFACLFAGCLTISAFMPLKIAITFCLLVPPLAFIAIIDLGFRSNHGISLLHLIKCYPNFYRKTLHLNEHYDFYEDRVSPTLVSNIYSVCDVPPKFIFTPSNGIVYRSHVAMYMIFNDEADAMAAKLVSE